MLLTDEHVDHLQQVFVDTLAYLKDFAGCLEQERTLLEQQELTQLEQTTAQKQTLVGFLQRISAECEAILNTWNLQFSDSGIKALLKECPVERQPYLQRLWYEIKDLLSLTQQYNTRNGMIINMLRQHHDGLIKLMTKQPEQSDYGHLNRGYRTTVSTREHKA